MTPSFYQRSHILGIFILYKMQEYLVATNMIMSP